MVWNHENTAHKTGKGKKKKNEEKKMNVITVKLCMMVVSTVVPGYLLSFTHSD